MKSIYKSTHCISSRMLRLLDAELGKGKLLESKQGIWIFSREA